MAQYTKQQLISASNAAYFTNVYGGISASAVRDLNDSWISSSALLSGSNTFIGNQIISGTMTAQLPANYIWLGDSNGYNQAVATSSISLQGAQGIQGLQGLQGTQGIQGITGLQGLQGLQGIQGLQGTQGIQGITGLQGIQGIQGASGSQGIQGLQGLQGLQGIQGVSGSQGTQGLQGIQGADNSTQGTQGVQGLQGLQGLQGIQGISGSNGAQGIQGIQGADNSTQGTQGAQGFTGTQGIQGVQGTQGDNVSSGSLLVTASFANRNITFTKGDATTFDLPGFATTGSNTFNGNQTITGQVTISGSASLDLIVYGNVRVGELPVPPFYTNQNTLGLSPSSFVLTRFNQNQLGFAYDNITEKPVISAYTPGGIPYTVIEFQAATASYTDGRVTFPRPIVGLQNLELTGSLTASLQQGYAWVGDSNNRTTLVATSSFGTSIDTGSFATTGSNTFYGSQTISGSVLPLNNFGGNLGSSGQNWTNLYVNEIQGLSNLRTDTIKFNGVTLPLASSQPRQLFGNGIDADTAMYYATSSANVNALRELAYVQSGSATTPDMNILSASFASTIASIVTGTGFATTGSNIFTGNQTLVSSSIAIQGSGNLSFPNGLSFSGNSGDVSSISATSTIQLITEPPAGPGGEGNSIKFINRVSGSFISFDNQQAGAGNPINFTGGAAGFTLNVVSGSTGKLNINAQGGIDAANSTFTASLANGYVWVGNGSNYTTVVATSSFAGSSINTGSFATTGSNVFTGNQTISKNGGVYNMIDNSNPSFGTASFGISGASGGLVFKQSGSIVMEGSFPKNLTFYGTGSFVRGIKISDSDFAQGATIIYNTTTNTFRMLDESGAVSNLELEGTFTASLANGFTYVGNASGISTLVATSSFGGGGTTYNNPTLNPYSGSLILVANTFTSSSFAHISASANGQVNLIFKNNNNTGDTIISGSGNIFTNPGTPNTGYIRYIGGNNNLYLNNSNGVNSQITASAASVSGARPVMNNNIFAGTANFVLNYASNAATTQNISSNITAVPAGNSFTINALAHTGSMDIYGNLTMGSDAGTTTLNPSSASVAEIALGLSGSGTFIHYNNINNNSNITITSNRNIPFNTITRTTGNIITGGNLTITNISSSANVSAVSNISNGTITYSNAGAAGLALHRSAGNINTNYGQLQLIASASAISALGNICSSILTVTNRSYSGSLGSGSISFNNNCVQGASNTYTVSGSYNGTLTTGATMVQNAVFGTGNTFFTNVEGRGNYVGFAANGIFGANLILTGSNNTILSEQGGAHIGRWNANDGIRNTTGENIFSVGTGTSTIRKTGFLIDSGSNSYFEGTLNVSGSTAMTGSLLVSSFTTLASVSSSLNFADDTAAAAGGVPLGGLYRNGNFVMIRLT